MVAVEFVFLDDALNYLISSLIGGLLCMVLLVIANKISKGGIGAGDIKLLSAVGFVLGLYPVLSAMLFSLLGFILLSALLLLAKKCSLKDQLPFGPFIYVGFLVYCLVNLH
jgi:prepilin signal peptidase PulO-like enzyme (type II secretory pathway)